MMISNSFEEEKNTIDLLKNLYIPIPEGFDEFINAKIEEGMALAERKENKHRHLSKGMIAVLVAIMILAIGVTVTASMDYYHKRMNMLSEQELEELLKNVDSSDAEAFSYSRPLSQEERERTAELRERYLSEGLFPEKNYKIINSLEEIRKDEVSFYAPKSFYYLPERALTDEELLEMIDYLFKANYALGKRAEKIVKEVPVQSETALVETAKAEIENMFGIRLFEYACEVEIGNVVGCEGGYTRNAMIIFRDKKTQKITVEMDAVNGTIYSITMEQGFDEIHDVELNEEQLKRISRNLKAKVYERDNMNTKIEKSFIKTELKSKDVIDGENVCFQYLMEDGYWFEFVYDVYTSQLLSVLYRADSPIIELRDRHEIQKCIDNNLEYYVMEVTNE